MISNAHEYDAAKDELRHFEQWLLRMENEPPIPNQGLAKAGLRKMIARLHDELGEYEATVQPHLSLVIKAE